MVYGFHPTMFLQLGVYTLNFIDAWARPLPSSVVLWRRSRARASFGHSVSGIKFTKRIRVINIMLLRHCCIMLLRLRQEQGRNRLTTVPFSSTQAPARDPAMT